MYRFACLVVLLGGISLAACSSSAPAEPVEEGTYFIRDDDGRVLILHGMNVMGSAKGDPGHVPVDITREYVQHYGREWGFNFARYLILWDGVEPTLGEYDDEYLDATEERLDWLWDEGIFVMLDMHQDVYSAYFGHNGAPEWAVEDDGLPFENQPSWDQDYFQPGVMRAFDNFWNYEGPYPYLQDHYADAWATVVERFKDHPAVIGYDLMNEPSPGEALLLDEIFLTPSDGPAADFDRTRFTEFYQRMIDRTRQVDPDGWIFYEPRYAAPANGQPSYIGKLNDPRSDEARIAYAPHLYSVMMELFSSYEVGDDNTLANWEMNRVNEVTAQRAPIVLGEWGFDWTWGNAPVFMDEVNEMADRMMLSWAYWPGDPNRSNSPGGWSIWDWENSDDKDRIVDRPAADALVRVYPQRVAGIPRSFLYEPATRVFELSFDPSPSATTPTEIFIPERRHYPSGWMLTGCDEAEGCTSAWDAAREILRVDTGGRTDRVELTISPAP
jgi:endoglycosylceramidase